MRREGSARTSAAAGAEATRELRRRRKGRWQLGRRRGAVINFVVKVALDGSGATPRVVTAAMR